MLTRSDFYSAMRYILDAETAYAMVFHATLRTPR